MSFTMPSAKGAPRPPLSTPAAWAADYDLMAFAEGLDVQSFTALSQGLGLGELRPIDRARQGRPMPAVREPEVPLSAAAVRVSAVPVPAEQRQNRQARRANVVDKAQVTPVRSQTTQVPLPRRRLSFERKVMAWSVDLLFVTSTLATALAVVTGVAAARAPASASLLELKPVTWLASFAPYQVLIGVYGIYLVYNIMFRIAIGRTFGESLMGRATGAARSGSAA